MRYPDENEIVDPSAKLPPDVAAVIVPYVDAAQRRYRAFRQRFRDDVSIWKEEPAIVACHAADVFQTLAALALVNQPNDFKAFRHAIGWEGGAAELAVWYAHWLYKDVRRGRMPFEWQWNEVEPRLSRLMEDAEDLWHNPDIVPETWENFLGEKTAPKPPAEARPSGSPVWPVEGPEVLREKRAQARRAFIEPILDQKGWSQLELATEADVDDKTVRNFLDGVGAFRSTRLKLASALGVPVERLPE